MSEGCSKTLKHRIKIASMRRSTMKRNSVVKGFSLLMAFLVAGCASYTPSLVKLDASGANVSKQGKGDMTISVEEYATKEKSKKAFDTSLAEEGVLPLLIKVENGGQQPYEVKGTDIVVREGNIIMKALTPEEAASRAKRSAVGPAVGWSLLVPIIAIPAAAVASAMHTSKVNKRIVQDFAAKAFPEGIVKPNQEHFGFLFFELKEERKDLAGLSLELTARNVVTGDLVMIAAPLPAATFTSKKEASAQTEPRGLSLGSSSEAK